MILTRQEFTAVCPCRCTASIFSVEQSIYFILFYFVKFF